MTVDSDVILPYRFKPDGPWSSHEENDSDNSKSQSSFTNDWIKICGALAQTVWLCHMQLSALAVMSFHRLRGI